MLMRLLVLAVLLALPGLGSISSVALAQPHVFSEIDLSSRLEGKKEALLEAGQGLVLRLTAPPEGPFGEKLLLKTDDRRVTEIEGGTFEECLGVKEGAALSWIISEYTGGAHCCAVYHFFGLAGPHKPIKYLGKTEGHNGSPLPIREALVEREGGLFFTDLDNRFDYFHASHADSMLVNLPERHYQLSPVGIRVNNLPFRALYLKHAEETQKEIEENLKNRGSRPPAILKSGYGSGFEGLNFSDELGQLLVKRTVYLLYARENQTAWQTFSRDVARFYQSTRWLPELKAEIQKKLKELPY
jgi:hypothetical protein